MTRRRSPLLPSYQATKIIGAVLLGMAGVWFAWMLFHHDTNAPTNVQVTMPGMAVPVQQVPALQAAGITLNRMDEKPGLSQQQALFLAGQRQPDAASAAKKVNILSALVTSSGQPKLQDAPAWVIWYQNVPLPPTDPGIDTAPSTRGSHDLYVFLDASTGKELLSIYV